MRLSKREMVLLNILLITASIYLYYNYIYAPLLHDAAMIWAENEKLSASLGEAQKLKQSQKNPAEMTQKLKSDYQTLLAKVPEDPYVPEMIVYLADAAEKSQLELKKIDYRYDDTSSANASLSAEDRQEKPKANAASAVKSSQLEIEALGTYYDILTFLLQVENAPRTFVLTALDLTATKRELPETDTIPNIPESNHGGSSTGADADSASSSLVLNQVLVGSAAYDGNGILLRVKFQSFFDQVATDNLKGVEEPVAPSMEGKNPFS